MHFKSATDAMILRRASLGPAGMAERKAQFAAINKGLPQKSYPGVRMMQAGGSLGCCGLGALAVPSVVKIGPMAARMIQLRKIGVPAKKAYYDAILRLHAQGETQITPEMHLQLAAGMQPLPSSSGLKGLLGALGLAPVVGASVTGASVGASAIGTAAAGAAGLGSGIALGQTVIPIPVVGAVIGAIAFEAAHLLANKHVGHAEASWNDPNFINSLKVTAGRDYDEYSFSEAFKGMLDTNNDIFPCCGADRHKNPDGVMGPLANAIAQGYLSQTVPLSATTQQVYNSVVVPWMLSGGGIGMNGKLLLTGPKQTLMMQAATDRYLAGEAMTRGDMPEYQNQGTHTPTLVQALAPILTQPTTTTPTVAGAPAPAPTPPPTATVQPVAVSVPTVGSPDTTTVSPSAPPAIPVGGGGPSYSPITYAPSPPPAFPSLANPAPIVAAPSGIAGIPTWALLAGGVALYLLSRTNSAPAAQPAKT